MTNRLPVLAAIALLTCGCASTKMVDSATQAVPVPADDVAQIVFLRSSFVGSAVQESIFDATSEDTKFIGILSNKKKLVHSVRPGKHVFMVVSEAADFMEADVDGGKRYYAIITPRMGAWRARFSMHPVRNGGPGEFQYDSEKFQSFLATSDFSENTPASRAWFESNMESIARKRANYWEVWQTKQPSDLAERTLNPDDGIEPGR